MLNFLSPQRRRAMIWLSVAIVALMLLAGGINGLIFQPGKNFSRNPFLMPTANAQQVGSVGGAEIFQIVMRGLLAITLVLLPISLIAALLTKEGRRRLITNILLIVLLLFVADRIQKSPLREPEQAAAPVAASEPMVLADNGDPLPPLPPPPSEAFVLITSVVVVLAVVALVAWFGRGVLFPRNVQPLVQLAREAERARSDLASGGQIEDIVIRCYRQMSRVALEGRKLQRSQSMTPREFEESLTRAGLPADPVQALTRIFEDVRYGGLTPGPAERQAAINSLTAIVAACQAEKQ